MIAWRKVVVVTLAALAVGLAVSPSAGALSLLGCEIDPSGVSCPF